VASALQYCTAPSSSHELCQCTGPGRIFFCSKTLLSFLHLSTRRPLSFRISDSTSFGNSELWQGPSGEGRAGEAQDPMEWGRRPFQLWDVHQNNLFQVGQLCEESGRSWI